MSGSRHEIQPLLEDAGQIDQVVDLPRSHAVVMNGIVIPRDVMHVIASHLDLRDMAALSATNYGLYQLTHDPRWARSLYVQIPNAPVSVSLMDVRNYLQHGFGGERTLARWDTAATCCECFSHCTDIEYRWTCSIGGIGGFVTGSGIFLGVSCTTDIMWSLSVAQRVGVILGSTYGCLVVGALATCGAFECMHGVSGKCAECSRARHDAEEQRQQTDPFLSKGYWLNHIFKKNSAALKSAKLYLPDANASVESPARIGMNG